MDVKDVVIIGAGPAGMATAIQLKRYGIEPLLLEADTIGGLLRNAYLVENYPGFPQGIRGLDLVARFKEHLARSGVPVLRETALTLDHRQNRFVIRTDRREITSAFVVVATGTKPKKMATPPIPKSVQDRIVYEIHPIAGSRNKKIAVIGAGDAAFDYALNLSRHNDVVILNRGRQPKCLPVLEARCSRSENIALYQNVVVQAITKENKRLLLRCHQQDTPDAIIIRADYVIVAVGRDPCLDFLGDGLKKNRSTLTKTHALHLVGDVKNGIDRQTAICVGDGVRAAMKIHRKITKENP